MLSREGGRTEETRGSGMETGEAEGRDQTRGSGVTVAAERSGKTGNSSPAQGLSVADAQRYNGTNPGPLQGGAGSGDIIFVRLGVIIFFRLGVGLRGTLQPV